MAFIARAGASEIGRRVKMADLKDDMDMSRIADPTERDHQRIAKYERALAYLQQDGPSLFPIGDKPPMSAIGPSATSRDAPRMAAFGPEAEAPVISRSLRVHGLGKALQLCVGRRDARWLHVLVTHEVSPRRVG